MKKVLITCPMHPVFAAQMRDAGFQVTEEPNMDQAAVEAAVADYEVLIVTTKTKVTSTLIDKGVKLEVIGRSGSGLDTIDVAYAEEKGIACFNSPEGNRNAVAEHAMAMVLALSTNLLRSDREVRAGIWRREPNRGFEWQGKTIGIIGFGNTGSYFAQKWRGFAVNVVAYDKYKSGFGDDWVEEVGYEELVERADLISFHTPLTKETRHWVNEAFVDRLPRPIVLVNTARGPIVDVAALRKGLDEGKIMGACLDVLPEEPPVKLLADDNYSALLGYSSVVFSPHIAGWTKESHRLLSTYLADKILTHYRIS